MPKKSALKASPVVQETGATLLRESPILLSLDDRRELRAVLNAPAFKKALHNARLTGPSEFISREILNGPQGGVVANNRLHEIRGWKMFEAALALQCEDPKIKPQQAPDDYSTPPL